jgi:hypothetical protein
MKKELNLLFNGNETFKSPPVKSAFDEANKKAMSKANRCCYWVC